MVGSKSNPPYGELHHVGRVGVLPTRRLSETHRFIHKNGGLRKASAHSTANIVSCDENNSCNSSFRAIRVKSFLRLAKIVSWKRWVREKRTRMTQIEPTLRRTASRRSGWCTSNPTFEIDLPLYTLSKKTVGSKSNPPTSELHHAGRVGVLFPQ